MSYIVKGSEIVLDGAVADGDYGDGFPYFSAADVRAALAKVGKNVRATVRLNSGGGLSYEGNAIAAIFAGHPGGVHVIVEGIAASAASVAACGAEKITMTIGSILMLHEASSPAFGFMKSDDYRAGGVALDAVNAAMAEIYARKSSIPVESIRDMMAAETWLTADDAVDAGFADAVMGEDDPPKPARFAYAAYRHPPAALLARQPKPQAKARQPEPPAIGDDEPLEPAELFELCLAAEQPDLAPDMIRAKVTLPQARARLDVMANIRPMLAFVDRAPGITAALKTEALSGRLTIAQVRERIFEAMASADESYEVDNKRPAGTAALNSRALAKRSMEKLVVEKYGPDALKPKEKRK